jgi:UDPglucose--hexose-1-phosphate uridylyltransferase
MPVDHHKQDGQLVWVSNPFTGMVTYFNEIHRKRSGFRPPPHEAVSSALSEQTLASDLSAARHSCPFCPGNEAMTPPEVLRVAEAATGTNDSAWKIRVFNNLFPRVPASCTGGRNESYVIVEDPRHFRDSAASAGELLYTAQLPIEQFRDVIRTAVEIARRAYSNPAVAAATLRKNQGPQSGASQPHIHCQVIGADRLFPPIAQERGRLREQPRLWHEIVDFASSEGFLVEETDGCYLYFCPFGTFPRSYEIVDLKADGPIVEVDAARLDLFTSLLYKALNLLGDMPLDYEIHDAEGVPLHAHINARYFPYSNIAGTLNLPSGIWRERK